MLAGEARESYKKYLQRKGYEEVKMEVHLPLRAHHQGSCKDTLHR